MKYSLWEQKKKIWVQNPGSTRGCKIKLAVFVTEKVSLSAAAAKSLQSCPTLCHPIDTSPPGSPIPGILQARTLEWVAISFSNAFKWKVKVNSLSHIRLFVTPWTAAYQAPPSMGFSRPRVLEWGAIAFSVSKCKDVVNSRKLDS